IALVGNSVMEHSPALLRRQFLQSMAGAAIAETLGGRRPLSAAQARAQKVVVVTFGGGARDDETFSPDGRENIPHLLTELLPRSTFYSQVINRGILGHYVATASLATGVYETFNNFAAVAPAHPTVFEYFRRDLKRPASDAWVIAPSNGFNRIGESEHRSYGKDLGAGVILPKRLLAASLGSANRGRYSHLLQDSYESPIHAPALDRNRAELERVGKALDLSVTDFSRHAQNLASPDELSVYIARQLMQKVAPSLLWITLHDIDVAHCGTFSLYVDAIKRSDRLCAELWKTIQQQPEYAGKTAMFILPDFGRDSDTEPGGNGFQHHRTGDMHSRTTWLLATGPGIRENVIVKRPVDSLDLVPTLGAILGFSPALAQGKPLTELI
ncbi:MAG TPA: hypothetical protein VEQ63_13310, partial [Bryobacteraceae bacterium]|nr:hypothetical protein [Bryobacteraceae bacterium]